MTVESVSVIIPTWNRVISLEAAVRSVLNQTVPVLEILVCDDGSTDGTEEMVKSLDDPRVKWCHGERGGRPAIPRNRGIHTSQGEWAAFLDDDDAWLPDKVERQLSLAEKLDCSAVCSNAYRILPGKRQSGLLLRIHDQRLTFTELLQLNQVICSSAMIKKELFRVIEGFPEQSHLKAVEDYALWLRVATQSDFAIIDAPLVRYFDDPDNSIRKDNDGFVQSCNVYENFLNWSADITSLKSYSKLARKRVCELHKLSFKARCKAWMSMPFGGSR